jgi:hypothetical protein
MLKIKSVIVKGLLCAGLLVLVSFSPPKLNKTKVGNDITILLPQGWRQMDNLDFSERYPSVRAPLAAFTDDQREIDFSVNISATQWVEKDAEIARSFFKASLLNMFDKVDMIQEGVRESHGKKFIYFEFNSRINGSRREEGLKEPILRYSYMQYYIEQGRTLVFAFNCPRRKQQEWQETAHKMMTGVKIKK